MNLLVCLEMGLLTETLSTLLTVVLLLSFTNTLVSVELPSATEGLPTLLTAVQPWVVCVSLFVGVIWGEGIRAGGRGWRKGRAESLWFDPFNAHYSNTEVVMVTLEVVVEVNLGGIQSEWPGKGLGIPHWRHWGRRGDGCGQIWQGRVRRCSWGPKQTPGWRGRFTQREPITLEECSVTHRGAITLKECSVTHRGPITLEECSVTHRGPIRLPLILSITSYTFSSSHLNQSSLNSSQKCWPSAHRHPIPSSSSSPASSISRPGL